MSTDQRPFARRALSVLVLASMLATGFVQLVPAAGASLGSVTTLSTVTGGNCVAWRPDCSYAVIGKSGSPLVRYDDASGFVAFPVTVPGTIWDIEWRPTNDYALIVGGDGTSATVCKFDGSTTLTQASGYVEYGNYYNYGVSWKSDGSSALIVNNWGSILQYDPSTNTVSKIADVGWALYDVEWNPTNAYALCVGDGIYKYNGTVTTLESRGAGYGMYFGVGFKSDGGGATLVTNGNHVRYYDGNTISEIGTTSSMPYRVHYAPSSNDSVIVTDNGHLFECDGISLYDLPTDAPWLRGLDWRSDSHYALCSGTTYTVKYTQGKVLSADIEFSNWGFATVENATILVKAVSEGSSVDGANVVLSCAEGGTFGNSSGLTDSSGVFSTSYTPPVVSTQTTVTVKSDLSKSGYIPGSSLNSTLITPSIKVNLTLVPNEILLGQNATAMVHAAVYGFPAIVISGGLVQLSGGSGTWVPETGLTDSNGDFESVYSTHPYIAGRDAIYAQVNKTGFVAGSDFDWLTTGTPPIVAPTLVAPTDNSIVEFSPVFSWTGVNGAVSYDLLLGTDPSVNESHPETRGVYYIAGTSYSISYSYDAGSSYYWKVRARNYSAVSDWSVVWNFSIAPPSGEPGGQSSVRISSGTGSFSIISSINKQIYASPDGKIAGSLIMTTYNAWQSGAAVPLIGTSSWGTPSDSFWVVSFSISTGLRSYCAYDINLTVPSETGTYYLIFAFRAETDGGHVASATNWAYGSSVWTDANDLALLSRQQILTAQVDGRTQCSWLMPSGYQILSVPLDAIIVNVQTTVDPSETGSLHILSGTGSFVDLNSAKKEISVAPNDTISGALDLGVNNTWSSTACLVCAPSWGNHAKAFWELESFVPVGLSNSVGSAANLTAPELPGKYYLVLAFWNQPLPSYVASGTDQSKGYAVWDDGNDLADLSSAQVYSAQTKGHTYLNWLTAQGYASRGVPSDVVTINVISSRVPSEPRNANASVEFAKGGFKAHVKWAPPIFSGDDAISHYRVYRGTSRFYPDSFFDVPSRSLEIEDRNLTSGTQYYYAITAWNAYGEGSPSVSADVITFGVPSIIPSVTAVAHPGKVILAWVPPENDGGLPVTQYEICRIDESGTQKLIEEVNGTVRSYVDLDVKPDAVYFYSICAKNAVGNGTASELVPVIAMAKEEKGFVEYAREFAWAIACAVIVAAAGATLKVLQDKGKRRKIDDTEQKEPEVDEKAKSPEPLPPEAVSREVTVDQVIAQPQPGGTETKPSAPDNSNNGDGKGP
jgi:hypothetical protein